MIDQFKALVLSRNNGKVEHQIRQLTVDDLPEGDVLVAVKYSSLNYKDCLAVAGRGKIVRQPLRHLGHQIRRRRADHDQIGAA